MTTPRDEFNERAEALEADKQLMIIETSSDGWHRYFIRKDALHLWRVASSIHGIGIQTAWIKDGRFAGHKPYYRATFLSALTAAIKRDKEKSDGQ